MEDQQKMSEILIGLQKIRLDPGEMIKNCESEYNDFISKLNQCEGFSKLKAAQVTKKSRDCLINCCKTNYLQKILMEKN